MNKYITNKFVHTQSCWYETFSWESRQESTKAMECTGNEMHSLMDERRKSRNVNNEGTKEGRKNSRKLRK